jgi:hypothetical protein
LAHSKEYIKKEYIFSCDEVVSIAKQFWTMFAIAGCWGSMQTGIADWITRPFGQVILLSGGIDK